jgi:hypothetical protein
MRGGAANRGWLAQPASNTTAHVAKIDIDTGRVSGFVAFASAEPAEFVIFRINQWSTF